MFGLSADEGFYPKILFLLFLLIITALPIALSLSPIISRRSVYLHRQNDIQIPIRVFTEEEKQYCAICC